ncbi:MAG: hypothetical protein HY903_14050 [Deltaproteobacteria bacterium]|nr:hypothetical protein [Deltaproteobacteria bacterium]
MGDENDGHLRVRKDLDGLTMAQWSYDASGRMLSDASSVTGDVDYVWLQGEPVAVIAGSSGGAESVYVLGTDQLGAPRRAWRLDDGKVAWAADYEAFGRAWEYVPDSREAPSISINMRFPGQYLIRP